MKLWNNMNYRAAHQLVGNGAFSGRAWCGFRKRAKHIRWLLSLKPGDLVHDCSAFNHRVKCVEIEYGGDVQYVSVGNDRLACLQPHKAWYISDVVITCSCHDNFMCHADPPISVAEIEEYHRAYWMSDEAIEEARAWNMESTVNVALALRANKPICDADGVELQEVR